MLRKEELCEVSELEEKLKPNHQPSAGTCTPRGIPRRAVDEGKPVKLLNPPTSCLSPIEELLIKKGLSKTIDSKFVTTMTRAPSVTQGNPFQVEVGLIFGEGMAADKPVEILRFANRVPLMYQQGGCLLTKAIESVDWRQYGLDQAGGRGVPKGPAAILVHLASTNVQFTSEAKEALSDNEMVMEEARKAMLEMGRGLVSTWRSRKRWVKPKKNSNSSTILFQLLPRNPLHCSNYLYQISLDQLPGLCLQLLRRRQPHGTRKPSKPMSTSHSTITPLEHARAMLVNWPERQGATMVGNELGGRKEAMGVWAWKLETLQPGSQTVITYSLDGLEKGDWNETDVFYRGSQEVIGATKMDEKLLEEIRRQEEALNAPPPEEDSDEDKSVEDAPEPETVEAEPAATTGDTKQTTLFGGDY